MWQTILKVVISASVIVAASELAKRSIFWGALIISLPLVSLMSFIWLYLETGDTEKISAFSINIFWLILPSLLLFIALPFLLRHGISFWLSMSISCIITIMAYLSLLKIFELFNIRL